MITSAPIQLLRGLLIYKLVEIVEVEADLKLTFCQGLKHRFRYIIYVYIFTAKVSKGPKGTHVCFHGSLTVFLLSFTQLCRTLMDVRLLILQTDIVIDANYHMHGNIGRDSVSVV